MTSPKALSSTGKQAEKTTENGNIYIRIYSHITRYHISGAISILQRYTSVSVFVTDGAVGNVCTITPPFLLDRFYR